MFSSLCIVTLDKNNHSPAADLNFKISFVILINLLFTLGNYFNHFHDFVRPCRDIKLNTSTLLPPNKPK